MPLVPLADQNISLLDRFVRGAFAGVGKLWTVDDGRRTAWAYDIATRARDSDFDYQLGSIGAGERSGGATVELGGTRLYILHDTDDLARAYRLRTNNVPFATGGSNISLGGGVWDAAANDGTTIWFVNNTSDTAVAYDLATRTRNSPSDIALGSGNWNAAVCDGRIVWFFNNDTDTWVAYDAGSRARVPGDDLTFSGSPSFPAAAFYDGILYLINVTTDTALAYINLSPPTGLVAAASYSYIDLSWTAPPSAQMTDGYRIEVSLDGVAWTTLVASQTETTYRHDNLPANATRFYRVFALVGTNESDPTPPIRSKTLLPPPPLSVPGVDGASAIVRDAEFSASGCCRGSTTSRSTTT